MLKFKENSAHQFFSQFNRFICVYPLSKVAFIKSRDCRQYITFDCGIHICMNQASEDHFKDPRYSKDPQKREDPQYSEDIS